MKPLRFGFVLDDLCQQQAVPDSSYWPNKVCIEWGAEMAYIYAAPDGAGYKVTDAVAGGKIVEALENKIDILICHLGVFDMFMENPDMAAADIAFKKILSLCEEAGTKVLFMDYGRAMPVVQNNPSYSFTNIQTVHDYLVNVNKEFPGIMSHTDLFWTYHLQWGQGNTYWLSDGVNYSERGHLFIADRVCGALTHLVKQLSNERIVTYACIGDSWTDTDTCYNAFDHWTRLVGRGIGAKLICDASVGGWTVEGLYNRQQTVGGVDQITWALSNSPDMIFMTIGGNDTWRGYKPETKTRARAVIQRLIDGGVQKILWSFYAQIGFASLTTNNPDMVDYCDEATLRNRFEQLRVACTELAAEFPDVVTFIDDGMDEPQLDYTLHPENFNNGADAVHPHDQGWSYLAPHLISGFRTVYETFKSDNSKPALRIGTNAEWLRGDSTPKIQFYDSQLAIPFQRKNNNLMNTPMKKLKFAFVGDLLMTRRPGVSEQRYWPYKVCQKFNAEMVYLDVDVENERVFSFQSLVSNGTIEDILAEDPDVLFCQLGVWDTWVDNFDPTGMDTAFRQVLSWCRESGTKLVLVDYYRTQAVVNNNPNYAFDNTKYVHDYYMSLKQDYGDIMNHTDLWWAHQLEYGTFVGSQDYDSSGYLTNSGNLYVADRVSAALYPLVKDTMSEVPVTFSCIGDSWTDVYSCKDLNDHWTRNVANALGMRVVSDCAVGGWKADQLYDQEVVMGGIDQVTWALNNHPDVVFMTISANDSWTGYVSQTKVYARSVLNRLFNGGVKKVLWPFYAQIGWQATVDQNPWVNAANGTELRSRFETLRQEMSDLADEYNGDVIFVDENWDNTETDYSVHPERYNNGADPVHLHDMGWAYLTPAILDKFTPVYNQLKAELNI